MKRIILSFILIFLTVFCQSNILAQDESALIRVADVTTGISSTVSIPVFADKNPAFASIAMEITYDNTVLKPKSVTNSPDLSGIFESNLNFSENVIKIVYACEDNHTETGAIFYLDFEVLKQEELTTPIELDITFMSNTDFMNVPFECEGGSYTAKKSVEDYIVEFNEVTVDENGNCSINATWTNNTYNTINEADFFVALYNNSGRLLDVVYKNKTIKPLDSVELDFASEYGKDLYKIKLFSFSDGITPIVGAAEYIVSKAD